ncbi:pyridoxal-dependent decarboxylase, exosortase A system-associated [Thauera aminoaromatica]|jgi:diaminopimelate decarboxylase|uniref:Pyridoxal-dependent decarboxylase, exosortase A system-associated n=2 Tax=Thauera aminoaromatica TaxID=164330 RepID=C4ZNI8_THASP|nr:pyridoxal-dependent decarboxylase, exosortase A system-associated [Thauera aminoaromatica]ACK54151.1 pyridoxal-dependent decarboxylase, exosortase system type 1 associated [Thauera aminoaromatica]ENO83767.1 Orn/DAP/Arg decarboxylase 2 [Thauera aminoaromatica S2]MCK6397943.1 pyridoxal-dependent decarboxylase, exosortase A system-associated [Thauera aminoaromatica]TXH84402.1 MAG: pyridoxal-dependent decarboxylase, exosortase A system-associated [Thauera aminoaromatica]
MNAPARSLPTHAPQTVFAIADGELQIAGQPLSRLAARVGRTPFYAYDRGAIARRVAELRAALPPAIELHYAMKANPMPALVGHLARLVDGIDVASAGELQVALDAGADPQHVSFAGPGKRDTELRQAVAAGILVNVESFREIAPLAEAAAALGVPARVAVRVNPDFELKSSGMKMGGGPKPFGVDAEQVPGLLAEISRAGLAFEGFHLFAGSQNLKAEAIVEAQRKSFELALRLAAHAPAPVRTLNLGGGFGIPYFPGEQALDLTPIAAGLADIVAEAAQALPEARIVLELGRYLVGEAGVYVCRITDIKVSRGHTYLVTDGGLHHHLSASGNFGQVIRKNYPVAIGNRMDAPPAGEPASVVGPLCTPLDVIADRMPLPAAQIGDLIVVFQSGAYGASASPQAFLGHPQVVEILA